MKYLSTAGFSYQIINLSIGVLIIFIFACPAIFDSGNYPVECVHMEILGEECESCGLTRSFSAMFRGNYSSAFDYNRSGPLLFGFFAVQFFLRIGAGTALMVIKRRDGKLTGRGSVQAGRNENRTGRFIRRKINTVTVIDASVSLFLFLVCFRYLLFSL